MPKVFVCLLVALFASSCRKKEEEVSDTRVALFEGVRSGDADLIACLGGPRRLDVNAFFVDIDGDGIDEVFVATYPNTHRDGSRWQTHYYTNRQWHSTKCDIVDSIFLNPTNFLYAHAHDVYYRDDVKRQPRLFVSSCDVASPASITLTADKYLIVAPFGKQEFDSLRKKGILKPVETHWYDKDNKIIRTENGEKN